MKTRRSPRNQEILWRALGEVKKPAKVKRPPLLSREEVRKRMFDQMRNEIKGDKQ